MSPVSLAAEFADLEQDALAEADRKFGDIHGSPDAWSPLEEIQYVRLLQRVHHAFHPDDDEPLSMREQTLMEDGYLRRSA